MVKDKSKPKMPDLGKEESTEESASLITDNPEKAEKEVKPRYVTVEKTDSKSDDEVLENKDSKEVDEDKQDLPEIKVSDKDVKVAPSFSLLDADKITPEVKTENKEEKPEEEASDTPKITLETSLKTSSTQVDQEKEQNEEKSEQPSKEVKKWLNDTPITEGSGIEESKGINKKVIFFVVIFMLIAGILGGGFYYYKNNMSTTTETEDENEDRITVRETSEPTVTPTSVPEVEEEIDLSKYSVSVLNGSGVPGVAGDVSDILVEAGFSDPDKGNAESYDYGSTQISMKDSVPKSVFDTINQVLSDYYDLSSVPAELDDESTYDIIIIVGADEPESEPTATPTPEDLED